MPRSNYKIVFPSKSIEKKYNAILDNLSDEKKDRVQKAISGKANLCRKVKNYRCYDHLENAQRILFKLNDEVGLAIIYFSGNHDEYMRALKKFN